MSRSSTTKRVLRSVLLVVVLLALGRLYQVQAYGDEVTLFPSAAPPQLVHEDRDYRRGAEQSRLPDDRLVALGDTLGGGTIYGAPSDLTPTALFVVADGSVWSYGLIGGP